MSATVTMRVYTGSGAGTESSAQIGFDLVSIDSAENSPSNRSTNKVAPGSNSFEKWLRLRLDAADGKTVSNFWVERTGDLPDGVVVKIGTTETPATPTASESTVARETMADGRRYWFDAGSYDEAGDHTRYLVLQEQVAADAADGAIDTQTFEWGWSAV
jgi:hypothetical protein